MHCGAHFQWCGPLKPGPEVMIAVIGEKSNDELGWWPWFRKIIAQLVDRLAMYQVKVIGFDMVLSSPDESFAKKMGWGLFHALEVKSIP